MEGRPGAGRPTHGRTIRDTLVTPGHRRWPDAAADPSGNLRRRSPAYTRTLDSSLQAESVRAGAQGWSVLWASSPRTPTWPGWLPKPSLPMRRWRCCIEGEWGAHKGPGGGCGLGPLALLPLLPLHPTLHESHR